MSPLEVFAPVDSTTYVVVWFGATGAVALGVLAWRAIHERAKRRDATTEVPGRDFLGSDHPDDTDPGPRYFITRPAWGWYQHEVSKFQYLLTEGEFGFRSGENVVEGEPATDRFEKPRIAAGWIKRPEPMTDADVDAMYDNVLDGTPLPVHDDLVPAMGLDDLRALVYGTRAENLRQSEVDQLNRPWADPNEVEPDPRRTSLARVAATHEQHLGIDVDCSGCDDGDEHCGGCACHVAAPCQHCTEHVRDHDDVIPVSPWDKLPSTFGQAVPVKRVNRSKS